MPAKPRDSDDENAVETALRTLRGMIFDGELHTDQPLRQDELAERLGTSRHPVREALGRLSAEGLVTFRSRRGYVVTGLEPEEINEIFEMRAVLEEHGGYLAALNRTTTDIEEAAEALEKMMAVKEQSTRKMLIWSALNRDFHAKIFAASGRRHLCRMIGTLRDSVESYIRKSVADNSLTEANAAHEELFESFKAGDALLLARLSRQHVRHSADALLDRLRFARMRDNVRQQDHQRLRNRGSVTPRIAR